MIEGEMLSNCKVCGGAVLQPFLETQDFMVSQESFSVSICTNCNFCFTNPRPIETTVAQYYEASAYLSHTKKKFSLLENLYSLAKLFTLRWKLRIIKKYYKDVAAVDLLDVGCGSGDFLKFCAKRGMRAQGIEPAVSARNELHNKNLQVFESLEEVNTDRHYDLISFWHVLEHIYRLDETLNKVKLLLKDDGLIFVALPNRKSYDALLYGKYWAGWDLPRHLWHFSQTDFHRLIEKHDLKIKEIIPMKLDAYYVSMLSERYKSKKKKLNNLFRGLIHGVRSNQKAKRNNEYSSLLYIISK